MLSIYFGRESIQKERFIFDHIKGKTLLLVPDQFTLGAEQRAFSILGVKGLMDLEVISPSRLGLRILNRVGGSRIPHVDQVGRHMLLTRIIREEAENMEAFKGLEGKTSFVESMNDMISEMKQFNTNPALLEQIAEELPENLLLKRKLRDIHRIYQRYEEAIRGKYADTEDQMDLFIHRMGDYEEIRGTHIWVWGFDYFTPKNIELMRELMRYAKSVSVVLTLSEEARDRDLFSVTRSMKDRMLRVAEEAGIPWKIEGIPEEYQYKAGHSPQDKNPAIATLEEELFAIPMRAAETREGITLVKAANCYSEAESGAAHILELVREDGFRFRDIAVVCNDLEGRGSIIKRTFEEYGIPVFLDTKRSCTHHPLVECISSALDVILRGWQRRDLFRMIKTGLGPLLPDGAEELENYAIKYRIRGNQWKKPFRKGLGEYGEEGLQALEEVRGILVEELLFFEEEFRSAKTISQKIRALYRWMSQGGDLPNKLETLMESQEDQGRQELADETRQLWKITIDIMDQLILLMGEEELPDAQLSALMATGFAATEIGLIPPTVDRLTVGTMQRTRVSSLKALLVIGANEGILPKEQVTEGLLSEDEKQRLFQGRAPLCKMDELRNNEEKLGIYRMLSMPQKDLWVGCAATDIQGKDIKPSYIFETLTRLYGVLPEKDILSDGNLLALLSSPQSGIRHLTDALRSTLETGKISDEWRLASLWFERHRPEGVKRLQEGMFHTGKKEDLQRHLAEALYRKEAEKLRLSPSGIEKYSRCPFSFLMTYGLKPEERRMYEIAGREIGDIYHHCLMKVSQELSQTKGPITQEGSPWMSITQEECQALVNHVVEQEAAVYREGLLVQGAEELYKKERIKRVCHQVTWALVEHVRQGTITRVEFEVPFGEGPQSVFPAIQVEAGGERILIEGKIDRADVLQNNRVKIIDYKSGNEKFDLTEVRQGYRLQLMLYLKAVQDAIDPTSPGAGVFYFHIEEPFLDASEVKVSEVGEEVEKNRWKNYRLDGVLLDDEEVIRSIAGDFTGYSSVCSLRSTKEGIKGTGPGRLLSEEEFRQVRQEVDEQLTQLCQELVRGKVQASPRKSKSETACDYCNFKSVCGFDLAFSQCRYRTIQ